MNIVGGGSKISGTIDSDRDLVIAGRFEGTIISTGEVYVYPEGVIRGRVEAKDLTVAGSIQGEIEVSNRLRVKQSACLEAKINTRFLDWEEGARLDGVVHTLL
jgi:cytoskeletal protein CcmA (bactofilin family)